MLTGLLTALCHSVTQSEKDIAQVESQWMAKVRS